MQAEGAPPQPPKQRAARPDQCFNWHSPHHRGHSPTARTPPPAEAAWGRGAVPASPRHASTSSSAGPPLAPRPALGRAPPPPRHHAGPLLTRWRVPLGVSPPPHRPPYLGTRPRPPFAFLVPTAVLMGRGAVPSGGGGRLGPSSMGSAAAAAPGLKGSKGENFTGLWGGGRW